MSSDDKTGWSTPEKPNDVETPKEAISEAPTWISGWRLIAIAAGQALSLFMVQSEASITSTAITAITDQLGGFEKSPWVFTAYLLTYGAFPIFLAKVSDILGRKQVLLSCILLFIIFSGACGAAQSLTQLIMFRWIKGLGAGGIYAVCIGYGFELRPPDKWPSYSAFLAFTTAVSISVSPLIGAGFTQAGAWRWCFLMNVPIGVTAMVLLGFAMPNKLRLEPAAALKGPGIYRQKLSLLSKLDFPGAVLLVGASALLTTALQQASQGTSFASPQVLTLLILAPIFLLAFVGWQWRIDRKPSRFNPIFAWKLLTNRVFMLSVCNAWLSGMVMTTTIFQIPQRLMLVNSLGPIDGGARLIPFAAIMTFTAVVVAILMAKTGINAVYTLIFGALLEIGGVVGLSQLSVGPNIQSSLYGFEIIAGIGIGLFNVILLLLTPYTVERQYLAVGNGAINQFRILGGSHGLAIVTCATSPALRSSLLGFLTPDQTSFVLDRTERIATLAPETQALVREQFGYMYNKQALILIAVAAVQVLVTALQWQKKPIVLKKQA